MLVWDREECLREGKSQFRKKDVYHDAKCDEDGPLMKVTKSALE